MNRLEESLRMLTVMAGILVLCGQTPIFAAGSKTVDEMLEMPFEELMDLEVSIATRYPLASEEAPSIVSVITAEEIQHMGARNIIDILRTVPGFDLTYVIQNAHHQGRVRGINQGEQENSAVVLINGHTFGAGSFIGGAGYFFDTIPVDIIKKIEIIRGPGSALYGSDAFNGVINIITRGGGNELSRISVEAGSFNTQKYMGELSYDNDALEIYLYADCYTTDGPSEIIESDLAMKRFDPGGSAAPGRTTEQSSHYTFFTNIDYKNFYINGYVQKLNPDIPVGHAKALTDGNDLDLFYTYFDLGYSHPLTDKGNLLVRMYSDYSDEDEFFELMPEETGVLIGFPPGERLNGNPSRENWNLGAEIAADYDIYPSVKLVAGASYEYVEVFNVKHHANYNLTGAPLEVDGTVYDPNEYFGGMLDISENGNYAKDASRRILAMYGQATIDMKERLSLGQGVENMSVTAGVRYDYYSDVEASVTPRFGVVYAPTEKLFLKALYGKGFDAPKFAQLYSINNPVVVGNPDLKPEKITTLEGLVGYNFSDNIKSSVTFFHNEAKDLIQSEGGTVRNVGKMKSHGLEFELKAGMDQHKYMFLNATWQDVRNTTRETIISDAGVGYTQEDFFPGGVPSFIANAGVNYDVFDWMIANVSLNYVGERKRSEEKKWDGETLVNVDDRDPVTDRLLLNAALTFRNFYKGMEARISGYNLLNDDHVDPDEDGSLESDLPRPGASFMVRLSYAF